MKELVSFLMYGYIMLAREGQLIRIGITVSICIVDVNRKDP